MSLKVSNLYSARIFAEHPSVLWDMDDNFDFVSLLDSSGKKFDTWGLENLQEEVFSIPNSLPLPFEYFAVFSLASSSASLSASAIGPSISIEEDLDPEKRGVSINAFVYDYEGFISSYDIGFIINGEEYFSNFSKKNIASWEKIFHSYEQYPDSGDLQPFIRINYLDVSLEPDPNLNFAINAVSVGQWSEVFHNENTGTIKEEIFDENLKSILSETTTLPIEDIYKVTADAYGIADTQDGYYIIEKNKMLSSNQSLPIVFGSNNVISVGHPVFGETPSMVFPKNNFLNESGRFKELTAEFWIRAFTKSQTPIRIFGPLKSKDGIYIERDYITIKIGPFRKSYFIGKWYRPMLIDFRYAIDSASLLINGDLVIDMEIDQSKINFPEIDEDYIGFFGNRLVYPFNIDIFAVYPYLVQEQIAKRRFVYAQGVDSFDNIASKFLGDSFSTDFSFAEYTSSLNYPDMTNWNSGFFVNSSTNSKFLSLPEHKLPEVLFNQEVDQDQFIVDNYSIQDDIEYAFIKLSPSANYDDLDGKIYFSDFNVLSTKVNSFYGIFWVDSFKEEEETIFQFNNNFNLNTFKATIHNNSIKYYYNQTLIKTFNIEEQKYFVAGIELEKISKIYSSLLRNFFSSPQQLSLTVGRVGQEDVGFSGRIYRLVFNNKFFTDKDIKVYVDSDGFIDPNEDLDKRLDYVGNYTLLPQILENSLILDVGSYGYWEDSIPLSYFGKIVRDRLGKQYYDLDLIQFNIEIPSPLIFLRDRYAVLDGGLSNTIDFDLSFDGGEPGSTNFFLEFDGGDPFTTEFEEFLTDEQYDTAFREYGKKDYTTKVFATIQESNEVGSIPYSQYENTFRIGEDRVLDFDNVSNFRSTKYEIVDGTIIFPPKEQVDFEDYYVTIHIEMQTKGIRTYPLRVKKMSFASLAFDESNFYSISSSNGSKAFPFSRIGQSYIQKQKNPFMMYRETSPYLYKTGDSGISVMPYSESSFNRGLSIPINQQLSDEYLLGGIQMWTMYNRDDFFDKEMVVAKIRSEQKSYDIKIVPVANGARATFALYNEGTEDLSSGVTYYQNGRVVDFPYIEPLIWNNFVFALDESIQLNSSVGQFEIYEGVLLNNIAFYKKSSDILGSTVVDKNWQELRLESNWGDWLETNPITDSQYIWDEVKDKQIFTTFDVNGKTIYSSLYGISSAIGRDFTQLTFGSSGVKLIMDSVWQQFAGKPV